MIKVKLTPELKREALDHLKFMYPALMFEERRRMEHALNSWPDNGVLRTDYRLEADMIVVVANALRTRAYNR